LDATDVAQAGRMVLIMDMLLNLSEFQGRRESDPQLLGILSARRSVIQW